MERRDWQAFSIGPDHKCLRFCRPHRCVQPPSYRQVKVKSLSRIRFFATPWTVAYQAPPSMGFSRQECWSELPFPSPEDLPDPGIEPGCPTLQADSLSSEPPGKLVLGKKTALVSKGALGSRHKNGKSTLQLLRTEQQTEERAPLQYSQLLFKSLCPRVSVVVQW